MSGYRYDIYLVQCKVTGKQYIGQAKQDPNKGKGSGTARRWKQHQRQDSYLCRAICKYGKDAFDVQTLLDCPEEDTNAYEEMFISLYKTLSPKGYNLTTGGQGMLGRRYSEQARQLMSEKAKARIYEPRPLVGISITEAKRCRKPERKKSGLPLYVYERRPRGKLSKLTGYVARVPGHCAATYLFSAHGPNALKMAHDHAQRLTPSFKAVLPDDKVIVEVAVGTCSNT